MDQCIRSGLLDELWGKVLRLADKGPQLIFIGILLAAFLESARIDLYCPKMHDIQIEMPDVGPLLTLT